MTHNLRLLAVALALTVAWVSSQAVAADPLPTFIVAGQSNAFRLGSLNTATKGQPAGATVYYYANPQCTKAAELATNVKTIPANKPISGFGAGIAWELGREFPEGFALIRYAVCGSNLHTQWMPTKRDGYYHQHFEPFLQQGLKKIEQASGRKPQVLGMLWHQGESNSKTPEAIKAYGELMPTLIGNFQETYGKVPFILGEIREFPDQPGRAAINRQMHKIAADMPRVAVAKMVDVAWLPEGNVHLSVAGAHEAGKRLVAGWKSQREVEDGGATP